MKKLLFSFLGLFVFLGITTALSGCGIKDKISQVAEKAGELMETKKSGDTAWQYEKTITEPIKATSGQTEDVTLGDLGTNKAQIVISKGAFDADTEVIVSTPDSVPEYFGEQIMTLGAPIEITANGESARLNEKAVIDFQFDKTALPEGTKPSELRVAYYNGTEWQLIKPLEIDMDKGIMKFETYHFSLLGGTKIKDETVITQDWIHSQTLDDAMKEGINSVSDHVASQIIDLTLEKMGISDKSVKGKVLADLLKDDSYKEIYDSYKSGDVVDMNQKIAILAGKKIAESVPESVWQSGLSNLTEGTDDVAAVAKAAGYAAEGQYKEAAKIIGEQIADKFLITTAGKIAVEVVDYQINSWKNSEVEAAYFAYKRGANGVFFGYNVDPGDFDTVWDQMRGIRRQLCIEAIKKEEAIRRDAGLPKLTDAQMDIIRDNVRISYKKQFEERLKKEEVLKEQEEKLKMLVDSFKENNLLDSTLGPVGLDKGYDVEQRLDILYHFAKKMMADTNRFELSDKEGLVMEKKISVADISLGARFYFSGPDGKKKYQQYLKDRYNIEFFPDLMEMKGAWSEGKMTITDVIQPEDWKKQAEEETNKGDGLEGCDFNFDFSQLKGKELPFNMTLNPTSEKGGTLSFTSQDGKARETSFTYEKGVIKATIAEKGMTGSLTINVKEENNLFSGSGSFNMALWNGAVKIIASVNTSKPVPQAAPTADTDKK